MIIECFFARRTYGRGQYPGGERLVWSKYIDVKYYKEIEDRCVRHVIKVVEGHTESDMNLICNDEWKLL